MPKESRIDKEMFESFCEKQFKEKEIAEYFGVDRTTLNAFCKRHYNSSFSSFSQQKALAGKQELVNKAMKLAESNGAVMIFLLKNLCKYRDTPAEEENKNEGITNDMVQWFNDVKRSSDGKPDAEAD